MTALLQETGFDALFGKNRGVEQTPETLRKQFEQDVEQAAFILFARQEHWHLPFLRRAVIDEFMTDADEDEVQKLVSSFVQKHCDSYSHLSLYKLKPSRF